MIPEKTVDGDHHISTTPVSTLAVLFPVVFALGIVLVILAVGSPLDQPAGYHLTRYRGGGYVDSRLFWGGCTLIFGAMPLVLLVITRVNRMIGRYGVSKKDIRLFSWIKIPKRGPEAANLTDGSDAATPSEGDASETE